jgi:hypothetical protein
VLVSAILNWYQRAGSARIARWAEPPTQPAGGESVSRQEESQPRPFGMKGKR